MNVGYMHRHATSLVAIVTLPHTSGNSDVVSPSCKACVAGFQLPIPLLVASVARRMKKSGWKEGHRELATTPTGSHQSLSSLHADATNHHRHQQHSQPANEYGSVSPPSNG